MCGLFTYGGVVAWLFGWWFDLWFVGDCWCYFGKVWLVGFAVELTGCGFGLCGCVWFVLPYGLLYYCLCFAGCWLVLFSCA